MTTVSSVTRVTDVQLLTERHRILNSVAGLSVIEEYLLEIQTEISCVYQITVIRDWDSGLVVDLSVTPVPSPPPRANRRGWWLSWVN